MGTTLTGGPDDIAYLAREAEIDRLIAEGRRFRAEAAEFIRANFPQLADEPPPVDTFAKSGDPSLFADENECGPVSSVKPREKNGSGARPHEVASRPRRDHLRIERDDAHASLNSKGLLEIKHHRQESFVDPGPDNTINPLAEVGAHRRAERAENDEFARRAGYRWMERGIYGDRDRSTGVAERDRVSRLISDRELERSRLEDELAGRRRDDDDQARRTVDSRNRR
jgi:hypothetical protein